MVDPDQFDCVFEVPCHGVECGSVGAEEDSDTGDADDTSGACTFVRLLVRDSAVLDSGERAGRLELVRQLEQSALVAEIRAEVHTDGHACG